MKKVKQILPAREIDMGGTPVFQPFPTAKIEQIDPFLLLHHHVAKLDPDTDPRQAGVGPHPHRGFSPVTFVYCGSIRHRDSRGNSSVVHEGGVQWMDAGMGIVHSERPDKEFAKKGGVQEIVQLWINLPKDKKFIQPRYIPLEKNELPSLPDHPSLKVVSGVINNIRGKINPAYPVSSLMGILDEEKVLRVDVEENENTFLYLLSGKIRVKGFGIVEEKNLVWFEKNDAEIEIETAEKSGILILSAQPLQESLAMHGPFVMNNETQILQAMRDYQMGKMGVLIEDF